MGYWLLLMRAYWSSVQRKQHVSLSLRPGGRSSARWRLARSTATRTTTSVAAKLPLFSFGVIADVQWMDRDVGYNYTRTAKRCYRGSLDVRCIPCMYLSVC